MYSEKLQNIISPVFNDDVLLSILSKECGHSKVEIKNVEIRATATNKGDSYLSSVVRFTVSGVDLENNNAEINANVIVKYLPKNIARRLTFRSEVFFKNEVAFYNNVWNVLLEFQKTKNLKEPFNNLPVCYSALADGKNDYVALEDLNCKSFTPFKRQGEMNYDTVILIIRLFARFHALSFAYKDQHPNEFKKMISHLEETYFHEKYRDWYVDFHQIIISIAKDAVVRELPESYVKIFEQTIENNFFEQLCNLTKEPNSKFALINEGDAWVPNFLCKYDSNNIPLEMRLIDFQLARCISPASDLSFFLYACTSYNLLVNHWDEILQEYHKVFTNFLVDLGSSKDIFPFDEFKNDFKKYSLIGVAMSMEAIPFQMMEDSETADLDEIQGNEGLPLTKVWKVDKYKTKEGYQRAANVFKHAVDMGFISIP